MAGNLHERLQRVTGTSAKHLYVLVCVYWRGKNCLGVPRESSLHVLLCCTMAQSRMPIYGNRRLKYETVSGVAVYGIKNIMVTPSIAQFFSFDRYKKIYVRSS